ncbi:MAG: ROK family protein [Clostridia bacterium]|nr:ROK family protein [Clostridia bacterium]
MAPLAVGIDMGGTNIKGALVNDAGEVLAYKRIPTEAHGGVKHVLKLTADLVNELKGDRGAAVGIGIPGMLDAKREVIINAPNLKWRNVPIKDLLKEVLPGEVSFDNDGNAAAMGEAWLGAGRGCGHFLLITIGTGIGSGMILDDKIYRGANGLASELGHMTLFPGGRKCGCGKRGCLETLASVSAILRMAEENGIRLRVPDIGEFFEQVYKGNEAAVRVLTEAMEYLSMGLANAAALIDPALILVGGGAAEYGEVFLELLRRKFIEKLPVPRDVRIVRAQLGNKAGALGAARMAMLEMGVQYD